MISPLERHTVACFMKCKWSWIHYLWPPFATITLTSGDPVVHSAVVLNSSPAEKKKPLAPSHLKSTLINARLCHGMQRFTAADVQRETRVDGEQHDEAMCVAEQAASRWQEDPRVYGWHINIWQYQYTFIDGLWRPVTRPLSEVFEDEMLPPYKLSWAPWCYHLRWECATAKWKCQHLSSNKGWRELLTQWPKTI